MESYTSNIIFCKSCNQRYNLSSRKPMVSTKCLHKACQGCIESKLAKDEAGGIICYQCQGITKPNKYREEPEITQILQAVVVLPIYCDNHPSVTCDILCIQCDVLTCKKCAKIDHKDHRLSKDKFAPEIYQEYLENAIKLLEQQKLSIDILIQQLSNSKDNDPDQKCSEFIKLYKDVKSLLSSLISDKLELYKLDLASYKIVEKSQPQEGGKKVEIVQPTKQYVHERRPQNNQTQGYLDFIKLVNIELERDQQSLLMTANINDYDQKQFKLLFQGRRDGFTALAFHQKCDNKGPTVCFILSEFGETFGGYASISWNSDNEYSPDANAFVFQLSKKTIHRQQENKDYAIYNHSTYLCIFGGSYGCDIALYENCGKNINSFCNFGQTYKPPNDYIIGSNEAKDYLAGKYYFKVIEIEVYSLQ
eukprot:403352180